VVVWWCDGVVVCGRKKGDSEEMGWGELLFTHQ